MLSIIYRKQQWFHYNLDGSAADVAVGDVFGEYDVVDRKRDVDGDGDDDGDVNVDGNGDDVGVDNSGCGVVDLQGVDR